MDIKKEILKKEIKKKGNFGKKLGTTALYAVGGAGLGFTMAGIGGIAGGAVLGGILGEEVARQSLKKQLKKQKEMEKKFVK